MTRLPRDSTQRGKKRVRNSVGEIHGPYRVDSYVGANPETSIYVRLVCKFGCGYSLPVKQQELAHLDKRKSCGGCGRRVEDAVVSVG